MELLILDGAMGTMLQKSGIDPGRWPDTLSITHPETVESIHRAYAESGADVLYTNTFGANRKKLSGSGFSVKDVVRASVECAKRARGDRNIRIALDVGPIGAMLEPNGTLAFDEAVDIFKEIVVSGEENGADLVVFETMTDLYEVKAALLAAKENSRLPVWCSMTFEQNGRTFTGCSVEAMAATLEGLGADALGINCSLGPEEIFPIAERLCANTRLPVFVKPNAGLPDPATGEYAIDACDFASLLAPYCELGVFAIGGCCGTAPEYIRALSNLKDRRCERPLPPRKSLVCSALRCVEINDVTVIGERINPTGKARFKQALREGDIDYVLAQAIEQADAGASILDVNVGLPEINEKEMMQRVVKELQAVCDLPLQLDSTRADVLEAGLRVYNGKPIVNSVNAEQKSLDAILPLCRKYGAAVVGLTLDENGIPASAEARFALAEKIVAQAMEYGIPREDIFIDCLTLTASAQQAEVVETLRAVQLVKEKLGVKTVLGVSNISFGLPCREIINTSFLTLAMAHGLDLPILNPNNAAMMSAIDAFRVLYNRDRGSAEYIQRHANTPASAPAGQSHQEISLRDAVLQGLKTPAADAARRALSAASPETLINDVLIPALDAVGNDFETGRIFLPQLLQSAAAAQSAFEIVKSALAISGTSGPTRGKIVVATVKGDIHDIGKNIVKVILENYGYHVIDLGRDVPVETVVEAVRRYDVRLVGLSALMTTTLPSMRDTIAALRDAGLPCKVMVGGAVLTPSYAEQIGADFYAKDAKASADIAKEVLG